jgi:hypothetical protein
VKRKKIVHLHPNLIIQNMRRFCLFTVIAIIAISCGNKKGDDSVNYFDLKEKKLPCNITCSILSEDTAQVLSTDVVNQLLRDFKQYQGNKIKIQTPIPEDWGVEYKLTPMSPDFDIWIITNLGEPAYKLLATVTFVSEIPYIIQAIPVSCNLGIEKSNFIESEQWTAVVQDDYKVVVTKIYEKLYSLTDTVNTGNESVRTVKEDVYTIELDGRITYEIPISFDIDYSAIIQFADTAAIGNVLDEQWLWNSIEIQEIIEPLNVQFCLATTHFDRLSIYNYRGDEIDIIDISSFLNKHNMGYLAVKKGKKPLFIPYSSSKECLQKALEYFGIENLMQENKEPIN